MFEAFLFTVPFNVAELGVIEDGLSVVTVGAPATKLRIPPFADPTLFVILTS